MGYSRLQLKMDAAYSFFDHTLLDARGQDSKVKDIDAPWPKQDRTSIVL